MGGARAADPEQKDAELSHASDAGTMDHEIGLDGQIRRRRRPRRKRTLGDKIRHSHKVSRVRRIVAVIVLGAGVIAASTYLARNSVPYDPVPSFPAE